MAVAGRYKALRKIADGGTAEVFLAEQVGAAGFRRLVVLKRIRSELYADANFRRILIEEAHVTMGLHHSNLVEVLDLGQAHGRYFLVLELVDGWTLQQLVHRARDARHVLPPEMAVYLVAEVCRALGYAHDRTRAGVRLNIVHRDVCPNNVLLSDTGEVKLTDFGIAKARTRTTTTAVGMVPGKPSYMSPEQASGAVLDARSDLFSVGTLLYYLLTAELPFKAPSDRELMVRVASGEFVSPAKLQPSLPKDVVKLVLEAMKREPAERFQSAQLMLAALEKVQRAALPPFGRSELEAWVRALNAKDGKVPVTRESLAPPSKNKPDEQEWIELSGDDLKPLADEPPPRGGRRWLAPVAALVAAGIVGGWWVWSRSAPAPAPVKVEAQVRPLAAPIPLGAVVVQQPPPAVALEVAAPGELAPGEAADEPGGPPAVESAPSEAPVGPERSASVAVAGSASPRAPEVPPPAGGLPGGAAAGLAPAPAAPDGTGKTASSAAAPAPREADGTGKIASPAAVPALGAHDGTGKTTSPAAAPALREADATGKAASPVAAPALRAPEGTGKTASPPAALAPREADSAGKAASPAGAVPGPAAKKSAPAVDAAPRAVEAAHVASEQGSKAQAAAAKPAAPAGRLLKVSGRLAPTGSQGGHLAVLLDSDPPGAKVKVDRRELGTTPTTLRFKSGLDFELTFVRDGYPPLVQWLTLVERPDKPPRVSLRAPPTR